MKRGCTGGAGAGLLLTPGRERGKSCLSPGCGVLGPLSQAGMLDGALPSSSFEHGGGNYLPAGPQDAVPGNRRTKPGHDAVTRARSLCCVLRDKSLAQNVPHYSGAVPGPAGAGTKPFRGTSTALWVL